jgi:hypothetical protein
LKTNFIEEQLMVNLVLVLVLLFYFANEKDPAIILFLGNILFLVANGSFLRK